MAKIGINIKEGNIKKVDKDTIVGIDLGTTNSLVAIIDEGAPIALKDKAGSSSLVPSILHFGSNGVIMVGDEAKRQLVDSPERTVFSVKRLMGKSFNDLKSWGKSLSYNIIEDDKDSLVKIQIDDRFYTPIELSAFILKELKRRASELTGQEINKAVITVPAYFNDIQRQATRDAGKVAGLDVLRIVNEPTAASLAYGLGLDHKKKCNIAVYDLGGGTFDVSILHLESGIFEVLATHGDTFLGGDDIDQAIVDYWKQKYQPKISDGELRLLAEEAKIYLSTHHTFSKLSDQGVTLAIDQEKLIELISPLVDKTISSCNKALADSELKLENIDEVILVGGSTRIPFIRRRVEKYFGKLPHTDLDPDETVALGAAIQGDILAGNRKDLLLLDVTPLSLGIETVGELMDVIIPRNSSVPIKAARQYTTSVDGQANLKVAVYQGERDLVSDNRKLGEFILKGIPPMAAGLPKIEISFHIDANGILNVSAKELRSGVSQEVVIKSQYAIAPEAMATMLKESLEFAASDMAARAITEARNEANHILTSLDRFKEQNKNIISTQELVEINALATSLRESVQHEDKDDILLKIEELNSFTKPLAEKAMDAAVANALKGKKV